MVECYTSCHALFPEHNLLGRRYFVLFRANENTVAKTRAKQEVSISETIEIDVSTYFEVYHNNSINDLKRESGLYLETQHFKKAQVSTVQIQTDRPC